MADASAPAALFDSKREEELSGPSLVKMWLEALRRAESEEQEWRKRSEDAVEVYRGRRDSEATRFNIFHSNVETITPAVYNSTPSPDVRRRYADDDEIGKLVADLIERSLSFSVDTYDFDAVMRAVVRDGEIVGRGVPRVRYVPLFGEDGNVVYESVQCDYVPWRYFRRGPGRIWKDVPWIAFGDFLTKDDVARLTNDPRILNEIPFNYSGSDRKSGEEEQSVFKRALVWQIWDKDNRRVISICPDYTESVIAIVADPLELSEFFPIPRPYQPVASPDSLTPIIPFDIYRDLVTELNDVTKRISRLVAQLRPRGLYAGTEVADVSSWANADDGELVPATNIQAVMGQGAMTDAISWFPLEPTTKALQALIVHREQIKNTIYEVTGIADILRGSTNAGETATAQSIKAQWGSLRIQDRQSEVARVARDLFRLKAEIIASKFSMDMLQQMTGIKIVSAQEKQAAQQALAQIEQAQQMAQQAQQAGQPAPPVPMPPNIEQLKEAAEQPSVEEVEPVLRSDITRAYRIDIESDSTIRGDLSRNQQNMAQFLQGSAQFIGAMAPIIEKFPQAAPAIVRVYAAFSRQFKLGKSAEDAIEQLIDGIEDTGQQPKTDPKAEADKAKAEADMKETKMDMQASEAEHVMKMREMQGRAALDQQELQQDQARWNMDQQRMAMQRQAFQGLGQVVAPNTWGGR